MPHYFLNTDTRSGEVHRREVCGGKILYRSVCGWDYGYNTQSLGMKDSICHAVVYARKRRYHANPNPCGNCKRIEIRRRRLQKYLRQRRYKYLRQRRYKYRRRGCY